jgi:hypothetical protein
VQKTKDRRSIEEVVPKVTATSLSICAYKKERRRSQSEETKKEQGVPEAEIASGERDVEQNQRRSHLVNRAMEEGARCTWRLTRVRPHPSTNIQDDEQEKSGDDHGRQGRLP